jgi:hypothetical protein
MLTSTHSLLFRPPTKLSHLLDRPPETELSLLRCPSSDGKECASLRWSARNGLPPAAASRKKEEFLGTPQTPAEGAVLCTPAATEICLYTSYSRKYLSFSRMTSQSARVACTGGISLTSATGTSHQPSYPEIACDELAKPYAGRQVDYRRHTP